MNITLTAICWSWWCFLLLPDAGSGRLIYEGSAESIPVADRIVISAAVSGDTILSGPGNQQFFVPDCQGVAAVSMPFTISSDLGITDLSGLTFSDDGAGLTLAAGAELPAATVSLSLSGGLSVGEYTIHIYYGSFSTSWSVQVSAEQEDNEPPLIVYPSQPLLLALDVCEALPAMHFFQVSAMDYCDGPVIPEVRLEPSAGIRLFSYPGQEGLVFLAAAYQPGSYRVIIRAADARGNTREEDFTLVFTQEDPPPVQLTCVENLQVTLGPDCRAFLTPDMVLSGTFGCLEEVDFTISVQDGQPENGPQVDGPGFFDYVIQAADPPATGGFSGAFSPERWHIQAGEGAQVFFDPAGAALTLTTGVNGPEPAVAAVPIPRAGVLHFDWAAGGATGEFDIQVFNPEGDPVFDIPAGVTAGSVDLPVQAGDLFLATLTGGSDRSLSISNWRFEPEGLSGAAFSICGGRISAEDKTPPVLICPAPTGQAETGLPVQFLQGALSETDARIVLNDFSCFLDFVNPSPGLHFYDLFTFTVSKADVFTFDLATDWGGGWAALFQGGFNPVNPCQNIVAKGDFAFNGSLIDFFPYDPVFRVSLPLLPGQTYTLMTSANGLNGTGLTGAYTWGFYSDHGGRINELPLSKSTLRRDLICDDAQALLLGSLPAGTPTCYTLSGSGSLVLPADPVERVALQPLLRMLAYTGYPGQGTNVAFGAMTDNCGPVQVCVTDQLTQDGDCGEWLLERQFTATDPAGHQVSCSQPIRIRQPGVEDVTMPPFTVFIECDEGFAIDEKGRPHPSVTGYPFLRTAFGLRDLDGVYCSIGAAYEDEPVTSLCEDAFKFRRRWTLIDWCNPGALAEYYQIIKVGDVTAPLIISPFLSENGALVDTVVFPVQASGCVSSFWVPLPEVQDNCSEGWEVLTEVVAGADGGAGAEVLGAIPPGASNRYIENIPLGDFFLRYQVTDPCGNTGVLILPLRVEDRVEPVASCNDELRISLNGEGTARIFAVDADEGSWDACGLDRLEIRRQAPLDSPWQDFADFTCADLGDTVILELKAIDAFGNSGTCWLAVPVEDKIRPACEAPAPVTLGCDELPPGFSVQDTAYLAALFGRANASDNCAAYVEELPPLASISSCGSGFIQRRFRAIDAMGNTSTGICTQLITLELRFDYSIRFPADSEANCMVPPSDTIAVFENACDLLAVSVSDQRYTASGDECFQIHRTYRVINWCEYDGESDPVVVSRDEDCDGQLGEEAVWVVRRAAQAFIDRDDEEQNTVPGAGEKGLHCNGQTNPRGYWRSSPSVGFWEYTQVIRVYDDTAPTVIFVVPPPFCIPDDEDCEIGIEYPFLVLEACTPSELNMQIFYDEGNDGTIDEDVPDEGIPGQFPKFKVSREYPLGSHAFIVQLEDGCGNVSRTVMPFEIVDCYIRTVTCIEGLAAELSPVIPAQDVDGDGDLDNGATVVWATDFVVSDIEDCLEPIQYSLNFVGEQPDKNRTSLVLTCDDMPSRAVEVYAWDQAGNPYLLQPDGTIGGSNYSYCVTYILVQDNLGLACPGTGQGTISGTIRTEAGEGVQGALVSLSGQGGRSMQTGPDGQFVFSGVVPGLDYTLTSYLNADPFNGVTTFDLLLITKHILGVAPLDSPYKLIAADINRSGHISTIDLIQLRKGILNIEPSFPDNTSWRFVPAAYAFPRPADPWFERFPEVINVNDFAAEAWAGLDFVGIKTGDVNLSARANLQDAEDRSFDGVLELVAADKSFSPGEEVALTVFLPDTGVEGTQFTLQFDPSVLAFEGVGPGLADEIHVGLRFLQEGVLTFSWNKAQFGGEESSAPLVSLVFKGVQKGDLRSAVHLSSAYIPAEAYASDGHLLSPFLQWISPPQESKVAILPNPFRHIPEVQIDLPSGSGVQLTFFHADGRLLHSWSGRLPAGRSSFKVNRASSFSPGLIYCRWQTDFDTGFLRLIKVD